MTHGYLAWPPESVMLRAAVEASVLHDMGPDDDPLALAHFAQYVMGALSW